MALPIRGRLNFNAHFAPNRTLETTASDGRHHVSSSQLSKYDNLSYRAFMTFPAPYDRQIYAMKKHMAVIIKNNKNMAYSLLGNATPILLALIFIPSIRTGLGDIEFGALVLIWALIGYFGIFDLGISKALVYHASKIANSPSQNLSSMVSVSVKAIFVLTLIGSISLFMWAEDFCRIFLKTDADSTAGIATAFRIVAVAIPFTTVGNALRGVLEGLSDFKTSAAIKAITFSAYFYVPALLAPFDALTLANTTLGYLIIRILSCAWSWRSVTRSPAYYRRPTQSAQQVRVTEIFSYGIWAFVTAVISPLMVYGDRFVVSSVLGASLVGIYAILQETIGRSLIVSSSFCAVLQPKFTQYEVDERRKLYNDSERVMFAGMALMYLVVLVAIQPVLEWWLGDDVSAYFTTMIFFVAALFFNSMAQLPLALLLGRGRPDLVAKAHAVEFLFYLPTCWFATRHFGLQGAAAAWLLRVSFDYGILRWLAKKTGF